MRHINELGLEIIKEFEGLRLTAYKCPAGVPSIGYGHTCGVKLGDTCTKEQAEEWLRQDCEDAEMCIERLVKTNLSDNEFSALVSFVFNVGMGSFSASTLLKLLNKGIMDQVPVQLMRWCKVKGEEVAGLKRRRNAEVKLWNLR